MVVNIGSNLVLLVDIDPSISQQKFHDIDVTGKYGTKQIIHFTLLKSDQQKMSEMYITGGVLSSCLPQY